MSFQLKLNALLVIEQWLAFTVLTDDTLAVSEVNIFAKDSWNTNCQAEQNESTGNSDGKFPLESHNVG